MKQPLRIAATSIFLALVFSTGCKPNECQQLTECCEQSAELEGVGKSCGGLAAGVSDPAKCESITQTIVMMYEKKGLEVPAVCQKPTP